MSKTLKISQDQAFPAELATSTTVIYGGKGMGKTNLGGVIVEELSSAEMRWSVIDPMGVWWGIRHSADGRTKGVECLILGGAKGDLPIEPTGGAVVADLVVDHRVNVVIDISRRVNGEAWSIGERIRFMHDYGAQLFKRQSGLVNGKRRPPICQVIDEAARFVPQMVRAGQPELAKCAGIWSAIVEEGRNVGIGVVLITQRSARLNKDVAELADVMLAFRTVGPNSIEAVADWLGAHLPKAEVNTFKEQVRSLPVGSCLAVSPGWLGIEKVIRIRKRHTFDSSATPKAGDVAVRGDGAKPDLKLYAERMRETIERAKEDDPRELKKRVRELEAKLAKPVEANAPRVNPVDAQLKRENAELQNKLVDLQKKASHIVAHFDKQIWPSLISVKSLAAQIVEAVAAAKVESSQLAIPRSPVGVSQPVAPTRAAAPEPPRFAPPARVEANGGARLGGKALQIAQVAAAFGARGESIDKKKLCVLLGMTMGGGFSARLSEARAAGAIVSDGSAVRASAEGIERYADGFHVPETTEEVFQTWSHKLGGKAGAMMRVLISRGGEYVPKADLAEAVGMTMGGGFSARLSEVRSTGLLLENGPKVAANPDLLFLR